MHRTKEKWARLVVGGLVVGAVLGGGVGWAVNTPSGDGLEGLVLVPTPPVPTAPPQPGEVPVIGPWQRDEPAPDLVPVRLDDGTDGFLRTYDLAYGSKNPEFDRVVNEHSKETVLPVYAEDGQTVIGEFVAGTASWD